MHDRPRETRRDVFTTTVIAGLGVAAAAGGAIGSFVANRENVALIGKVPLATGLAGSFVAVFDTSSTSWFFFQFDSDDPHTITMYQYKTTPDFPGKVAPSNINVLDTASWFASLKPPTVQNASSATIKYTKGDGTSGKIVVSTNNAGVLSTTDTSVNSLLVALLDMKQIPGSWNEIGVK
jgi:hypothetical protein